MASFLIVAFATLTGSLEPSWAVILGGAGGSGDCRAAQVMSEHWAVIIGRAIAIFCVRLGSYCIGQKLPFDAAWVRGFKALPGCLITALTLA